MLLFQICFTSYHVSGIFAGGFTWLIALQSLSIDMPILSSGSFTSSLFRIILAGFIRLWETRYLISYTSHSFLFPTLILIRIDSCQTILSSQSF